MSLDAYQQPGSAPAERPPVDAMSETTRSLHARVDAAARAAGVPYLHPDGPTVQVDLLGGRNILAWQEQKTARVMLQEQSWSDLPQIYARYGTETGRALIAALAELEGAKGVVLTDSGMQAIALTFDVLLQPGAHALVSRQVYNKTKTYLAWLSDRLDLQLGMLNEVTPETLAEKVRPNTALVFAETFTNPLLRALDPAALSDAVVELRRERAESLRLVIDNTIATPWAFARPLLDYDGIDVIASAGTKALGGQDRDMWGYVAATDVGFANRVMDLQAMRGGVVSWRVARAAVERLADAKAEHARRCETATEVASFLRNHPAVSDVFHPSLPDHPDRPIIDQHYQRHGSFVSFRIDGLDEDATGHFCDVLATTGLVRYALSFDGWVTKVNHHKSVSEFHTPDGVLRNQGIDRMVRFAVGLEATEDIVGCLNWALCHHRGITAAEVTTWQDDRRRELYASARVDS